MWVQIPCLFAGHESAGCMYRYENQTGVDIRAYDFGGLGGVAALDPDLASASGTYDKLIDGLEKAGYQAGQDLFGAPYDFRLAADGLIQV